MKKLRVPWMVVLAFAVLSIGCGGSGENSGSGSVPGAAPTRDNSNPPTPPPADINSAPLASAGLDQTVSRGTGVYLEGTASSDPDGDLLCFQWTILSQPAGSTASLSRNDQPSPYFTPDREGDYVIQLIVIDAKGLASSGDTVTISTVNSAPVADAGPDRSVTSPGAAATLGSGSWDPDGDSITHAWIMTSKPDGSLAALSDPSSPDPTFVADVYGDYVIELVVSDGWASSAPDSVKVSLGNLNPVADAGTSLAKPKGSLVNLDGSASHDPNGDPITFQWSFVNKPAGSTAELMAPTEANPFFTPDLVGTYVLNLVVSDGAVKSDPSVVAIVVFSTVNPPVQDLLNALEALNSLPSDAFKNRNMKKTLGNKINAVIEKIGGGYYQAALSQLENDILKKINGCAEQGSPENNDWIVECGAQDKVYPHITSAITALKTL